MKKYKVGFTQKTTGYVEVFADSKDDAENRLLKQPPLRGQLIIYREYIEYDTVDEIK